MKNIFTTIEYIAEKIKEAITGHQNDEQAHPQLSEQINVLFEHFYWDLSEITMNNNSTLNDIFNAMKDKSQLACGIVNGGTDIYPRAYGTLKITRITSLIGCAEFSFDKGNRRFIGDFRSVSTNLTEFSGWKEIATTTKTDISFPFNDGYSGHWSSSNKIVKNSLGQCVMYVSVKKNDGSDFTPGIVTIGTLPQGFKSKLNCGVGAYTEKTAVGAGAFIYNQEVVNVNVQSNCKVVAFTLFYEVI